MLITHSVITVRAARTHRRAHYCHTRYTVPAGAFYHFDLSNWTRSRFVSAVAIPITRIIAYSFPSLKGRYDF